MHSPSGSATTSQSATHDATVRRWPVAVRVIASVVILLYLALVVLGPMTTPVSAPHLTTPVARAVAPAQQALFLGHGYRFFGPDPGPSHSLAFEVFQADGSSVVGHFPDRDQHWPRLLYHRWFMLSETLFRDGAMVPSDEELAAVEQQYESEIENLYLAGKFELRRQLIREREQEREIIDAARRRRDMLIRAIARNLLQRYNGTSVRLILRERSIPAAELVAGGMKLTDTDLISEVVIGTFDAQRLDEQGPLFEPGRETIEPQSANDRESPGGRP